LAATPLTRRAGDHDIPHTVDPVNAREQEMNAPPNIDTVTDSDGVHWRQTTPAMSDSLTIFSAELCVRPQRAGIPSSGRRFIS